MSQNYVAQNEWIIGILAYPKTGIILIDEYIFDHVSIFIQNCIVLDWKIYIPGVIKFMLFYLSNAYKNIRRNSFHPNCIFYIQQILRGNKSSKKLYQINKDVNVHIYKVRGEKINFWEKRLHINFCVETFFDFGRH